MQFSQLPPQAGMLQACIDNCCPAASTYDRWALSGIATEQDNVAAKGEVSHVCETCKISEEHVQSLKIVAVHHRGLIPDDESSSFFQLSCQCASSHAAGKNVLKD